MASVTTDIARPGQAQGAFADRLVQGLERLARLSATYRRADRLARTSDADLAAQGLTRQAAAERAFGSRFYL